MQIDKRILNSEKKEVWVRIQLQIPVEAQADGTLWPWLKCYAMLEPMEIVGILDTTMLSKISLESYPEIFSIDIEENIATGDC